MNMAKARKFNAFSGVFTPSVLTIIGVIMYLRLPAIVGQAGLLYTLGIILVAHVISVTTSLSIASLATDKPVRTGGPYFIISRSMGLPIGGTLGLALFAGYAFSISLYLIGFSESFLHYWNFDTSINNIRLTGGIALIAITIITYISTSLALKSQFVIMAAIALSLLSIFLGKHDFTPETVNLKPLSDAAPFMVLFGIFFPAVTGFGAGISMSGDLKNPKKALPLGTLAAVGVGLVIYIGLSLFLSFTVDAGVLASNPQILFQISWVPALVVAGIWGATISSALGSILGAPRILQAIAIDKILPGIFARGTKQNNEPRNALWIVFAIAAGGIMIGDLNVIARIVSMFFITTYAFLNLAYAIESWSSPDFRPAFRIPRFVSIVGALSAFLVMILLDFLALAGATLVLGGVYFYLQRKQLLLESGDAWSSFWTNLAKKSLLRLSAHKDNERNWRPNIVLFSGGGMARPHLVELGLSLTGKLGALTDFELITGSTIGSHGGNLSSKKRAEWKSTYFTRQLKCSTVEEGIKTVTSIYGFSGFEPNTVLTGWSKSSESSAFLAELIKDFRIKNLNALFLDYDKEHGFGKKERIDIWWNGKGRHLTFSLNTLRFLLSDPTWRDARVRIMIVNSSTSITDSLYRNTNALLLDKRIKAEVKVIHDDFASRSLDEIISTHSAGTDLIMLGLTQKNMAQTQEYIEKVNRICALPSSVLLMRPSFEFEVVNFMDAISPKGTSPAISTTTTDIIPLPVMNIALVKNKVEKLDGELMQLAQVFCDQTIYPVTQHLQSVCSNLMDLSGRVFNGLQINAEYSPPNHQKKNRRSLNAYQSNLLRMVQRDHPAILQETGAIWQSGINGLLTALHQQINTTPEKLSIPYLLPNKKRETVVSYPFQKALSLFTETEIKTSVRQQLHDFEHLAKAMITDIQSIFFEISDILEKTYIENAGLTEDRKMRLLHLLQKMQAVCDEADHVAGASTTAILSACRATSIKVAGHLNSIERVKEARKQLKPIVAPQDKDLIEYAEHWSTGVMLLHNTFSLDLLTLSRKTLFKEAIVTGNTGVSALVKDALLSGQTKLIGHLKSALQHNTIDLTSVTFPDGFTITPLLSESYEKAVTVIHDLPEEIEVPESVYEDSRFIPFSGYSPVTIKVRKSAHYHSGALFFEQLYRDFEKVEVAVKKAMSGAREADSMLMFHVHNAENALEDGSSDELNAQLFSRLLKQVENEKGVIEDLIAHLHHDTSTYISDAFSPLYYHALGETGQESASGHQKRKNKHRLILWPVKQFGRLKNHANSLYIRLLHVSSRGVILSKTLFDTREQEDVPVHRLLDLVEELTPDPQKLTNIPVFYRNLMNSASKIPEDFWVDRPLEVQTLKAAYRRHQRGHGGAVLITGVNGAGKTALTRYAVNHIVVSPKTLWIKPPVAGSTQKDDLLAAFKSQSGNDAGFQEIFEMFPQHTTVVLDDIELWWERQSNGVEAMETILRLVRKYSHKVLFILNCNMHAYQVMDKLFPLHEQLLTKMHCSRFNTKDLQQMILRRHRSSGLPLSYLGSEDDQISRLTYSLLFHRHFNVSGGVPGVALNHWINNIKYADQEKIEIQKPCKRNPDILHDLNNDWLIVLALLVQHRVLNGAKLSRIMGNTVEQNKQLLTVIGNSGMIRKHRHGYYELNPFMEPLIVEACEMKGLI
jgi:amino acid transporter